MFFKELKEYFYKNTEIILYYRFIQIIFSKENNAFNGISALVDPLHQLLVGGAWDRLWSYKRVTSNNKMRGMRFERMNLYRNGS
jgi:hypothetical protein